MLIEKQYSYARPTLVTMICPVCGYKHANNYDHGKNFVVLETMHCHDHPNSNSTVRLYACPKCGSVGIGIEDKD